MTRLNNHALTIDENTLIQEDGKDEGESVLLEDSGRNVVVYSATFILAMRRERFRREALKYIEENNLSDDIETVIALINFFSPICGCSKGDIPSIPEFISMTEKDIDAWYKVVVKKNPHWFDLGVPVEEKKS